MAFKYPEEYYTHVGSIPAEEFVKCLEVAKGDEVKHLLQYQQMHEEKYRYNKLYYFQPDEWFMEVPKKMVTEAVCGAISGNRTGKSFSATWLYACHLTGIYPNGYEGYKFDRGIDTWCLTSTAEQFTQAGGLQEYLFGSLNDIGSGWIPKDRIIKVEMGIGTKGFIKKAYIKHSSGETSTYEFKSYSQGIVSLMGSSISFALVDEEAPYKVLTQVVTRTATPKTGNGTGRVLVSMTPELGMSPSVTEFFEGHWKGGLVRGSVYDCSHLTPDDIEAIKKRYPPVQHDMRLLGLPQLGSGAVFDIPEQAIKVAHVPIQPSWKRIMGIDFSHGGNDPTVVLCAAKDPVTGKVYLYNGFQAEGSTLLPDIARKIVPIQQGYIPLMRPADAARSGDLVSQTSIKELYEQQGVKFHSELAGNWHVNGKDKTKVVGVEYIRQLMHEGLFYVDASLDSWFKEYRQYCWVNGKLKDGDDHWMDATRYAVTALDKFGLTVADGTRINSGQDRFHVSDSEWGNYMAENEDYVL